MKKLKPFVGSCYSEFVLNPELDPANKGKEPATDAKADGDAAEKEGSLIGDVKSPDTPSAEGASSKPLQPVGISLISSSKKMTNMHTPIYPWS